MSSSRPSHIKGKKFLVVNAAGRINDKKRQEHVPLNTCPFFFWQMHKTEKIEHIDDVVAATKRKDPISNTVKKSRWLLCQVWDF